MCLHVSFTVREAAGSKLIWGREPKPSKSVVMIISAVTTQERWAQVSIPHSSTQRSAAAPLPRKRSLTYASHW